MAAAFAGGARTMFVFYLAGTAAMTWTRSPKHTLIAGLLVTTSFRGEKKQRAIAICLLLFFIGR
jgi:hypothetical protein